MHLTKLFLFMTFLAAVNFSSAQEVESKILFCYGDLYPEQIKGYDYVILEPIFFSKEDVAVLKSQNKNVLAYISIGEVNVAAAHYNSIKSETTGTNEEWNSRTLNISAPLTIAALNEQIDNHLTKKEFSGLFLDNVDNYTEFGPTPHLKDSLVGFLKNLKLRFRESVLMQNAGLFIIEDLRPFIDVIAVESVATDYNFEKKKYRLRKEEDFKERLERIERIKKEYCIPILLIEYADSKKLKMQVEKRLKAVELDYFLGQIELQKPPVFKK